jgi:hypothetical protein
MFLDQDKANFQSPNAQRQLKEANFARAQRLFKTFYGKGRQA